MNDITMKDDGDTPTSSCGYHKGAFVDNYGRQKAFRGLTRLLTVA